MLAGLIAFASSSCKKVLEPELEYAVDGTRLSTITDFERVLNGAYGGMRSGNYYNFMYLNGADVSTDNLVETSASLGNNRTLAQWQFNTGTGEIASAWIGPYSVINQANSVLDNIENLVEQTPGEKNRIKGQALAIRALGHFDLMRYFAASYERNSSELGVVIKLRSEADFPARVTVKESYDQIYKDLTEAEELLGSIDKAINAGSRRIRMDINAVRALRARVSLYAGDWQDAKDYATKVIDNSGIALSNIGVYGAALTSNAIQEPTSFQAVWFDDFNNSAETIFAVAFNVGQGGPGFFPNDGLNAFTVSEDWKGLFGSSPTNDVRYNITYDPSASPSTESYLKYSGRYDASTVSIPRNGNVDVKVFRMAEMYLIRAEANFNLGLDAEARDDVRTLRGNRIQGYNPASDNVVDILGEIQLERRKELVGEGHRWFDARRYQLGFDREVTGDCTSTAPECVLPAGDKRFILPIPLGEMDANSNMVQNPGW